MITTTLLFLSTSDQSNSQQPPTPVANVAAPASDTIARFDAELQRRYRVLLAQVMHFAEPDAAIWRDTPDQWVMFIMNKLRAAAINIKDPDQWRKHLLITTATLLTAIIKTDDEIATLQN